MLARLTFLFDPNSNKFIPKKSRQKNVVFIYYNELSDRMIRLVCSVSAEQIAQEAPPLAVLVSPLCGTTAKKLAKYMFLKISPKLSLAIRCLIFQNFICIIMPWNGV